MRSTRSAFAAVVLLASLPACGDDSAGASGSGGASSSSADATSAASTTGGAPSSSFSSSGTGASSSSGGDGGDGDASSSTGDTTSSGGGEGGTGGGTIDVCAGPRPGPDNTGVPEGVVLTPSGSITVDEDGAVIEGLDIDGAVTILADDVTIRNCRIRSSDYYPIRYFDEDDDGEAPTGLVVEDTEIEGLSEDVTAAISFENYTARRLNVHGSADGFKANANVLIEDCWVHDLGNYPKQHNDAVQSTGGRGVTIRHSDFSGASNAAVQTGDEGVATEDLLIECSWLSGGGYTLNIRGSGDTVPRNTRILNNRFGRDSAYGPWTLDDPDPTVEGNVWDDDGTPIPYP